jgi:hypothetical protein
VLIVAIGWALRRLATKPLPESASADTPVG